MGGRRQRQAQLSKVKFGMEKQAVRSVDKLAEFEEFHEMFLPSIRKDLVKGASAEEILKKYKPIIAARLVQLGATGGESAALGAIKELLDRTEGKAVQKQEHTHRLARLPEDELNAVIASKLSKIKKDIEIEAEIVDNTENEED